MVTCGKTANFRTYFFHSYSVYLRYFACRLKNSQISRLEIKNNWTKKNLDYLSRAITFLSFFRALGFARWKACRNRSPQIFDVFVSDWLQFSNPYSRQLQNLSQCTPAVVAWRCLIVWRLVFALKRTLKSTEKFYNLGRKVYASLAEGVYKLHCKVLLLVSSER